jgi:methyltransferase (TIGR00027 family)
MRDSPSATALLVARGVAFQSTHPRYRHLVPEAAGELTRRFLAATGRPVPSAASRLAVLLTAMQEHITVPGITLHYVLRKRAIEELVRAALDDGYRQVVVLGAGLDTLALRLARDTEEVTLIEIDHPATQRLKREVARELSAGVEFLPVDFTRESLSAALARCSSYDPRKPAVFVAEAVLLYLDEAVVREVFAQVRQRDSRNRIIFTFFDRRPRKGINFRNATWLADFWLRLVGEPARWAIAPEAMQQFVEQEGFTLIQLWRDREFQHRYVGDDVPLARGEHIAVAERVR